VQVPGSAGASFALQRDSSSKQRGWCLPSGPGLRQFVQFMLGRGSKTDASKNSGCVRSRMGSQETLVSLGPSPDGWQRPPQEGGRGMAGLGGWLWLSRPKLGWGGTHLPDLEPRRRWWQQKRLWGGGNGRQYLGSFVGLSETLQVVGSICGAGFAMEGKRTESGGWQEDECC